MSINESLKRLFDGLKETSQSLVESTKIKVDLSKDKEELKNKFLELGKIAYEKGKDDELKDANVKQLIEEIDLLDKNITEKLDAFKEHAGNLKESGKSAVDHVGNTVKNVVSEVPNVANDAKEAIQDQYGKIKAKLDEKKNADLSDIVVEPVEEELYFTDEDFANLPEEAKNAENISYENTVCSIEDEAEQNMCCGFGDDGEADDDVDEETRKKLLKYNMETEATHVNLEKAPEDELSK